MVTKRGKFYHIRFRPFGGEQVVGLSTLAKTKLEAKSIEMAILMACRSQDYRALDLVAREACFRMFRNHSWEIPAGLTGQLAPLHELTLWEAIQTFLKYPEINQSATKWRYHYSLLHLVKKLGKETPVKSIRVPELKQYRIERLNEGAAPATVNKELGTLSRLFNVLLELDHVEINPVRLVRNLSEKSGEREVYLSHGHVTTLTERVPEWYAPLVLTAYFTGMRRGEILGLKRKRVNLAEGIIYLGSDETKERNRKRVPIHPDLVPVLEKAFKVSSLESDRVFLIRDANGVRPPSEDSLKNPWRRACKAIGLTDPRPRFNDLRATWKTNARRSGMHVEIEKAIMGHSERGRSVHERYGRISNQELVQAVGSMTFDHGPTEILVNSRTDEKGESKTCTKRVQDQLEKKKGHGAT